MSKRVYAFTAEQLHEHRLKCASRGGKKKNVTERWCIEGENLAIKEISERAGLCEDTIRRKLKILRTKPDAITWASIKQRRIKQEQDK